MYADAVGGDLLANMTEFGKSPYLTVDEFAELGYNIVIFPVSTLRAAAKTTGDLLTDHEALRHTEGMAAEDADEGGVVRTH